MASSSKASCALRVFSSLGLKLLATLSVSCLLIHMLFPVPAVSPGYKSIQNNTHTVSPKQQVSVVQLSSGQMHAKTHTRTVGIAEDQMKLCTKVPGLHKQDHRTGQMACTVSSPRPTPWLVFRLTSLSTKLSFRAVASPSTEARFSPFLVNTIHALLNIPGRHMSFQVHRYADRKASTKRICCILAIMTTEVRRNVMAGSIEYTYIYVYTFAQIGGTSM